ncbi:kleisin alpha SCDLUD_002543 [Saccharomycodes ludwigii]|uniref:kleisin alpha n=1 Tax=Saccharomycodes ludwigii TaxID=36035 RepID=UPI001E86B616|nr:hypothetical protein SCDLUD_002543 [Saccharomycodes ludwigii]KAH3901069.1 hypothetical protein SCDLUD_002543 [Saccharomycodes ludwigii]
MTSILSSNLTLAQIWIAANLDKKINRTQSLQTDIISSTKEIARIATSTTNASAEETPIETIGLRVSGQLLYGVVRIYSNKTKYLLNDISETLIKLKSAFRSNAFHVTTPAGQTMVSNVTNLILQDTVTEGELFYQEPLSFLDNQELPIDILHNSRNPRRDIQGAEASAPSALRSIGSMNQSMHNNRHNTMMMEMDDLDDFDESLEFARGDLNVNIIKDRNDKNSYDDDELRSDGGFDLDFEISGNNGNEDMDQDVPNTPRGSETNGEIITDEQDQSMEVGRPLEQGEVDIAENPFLDMDLGLNDEIEDDGKDRVDNPHRNRPVKNSALKNTKLVLEDDDIEMRGRNNEEELGRDNTVLETPPTSPQKRGDQPKSTKRNIEKLLEQSAAYLPDVVFMNLVSYQAIKRQKIDGDHQVSNENVSIYDAPPSPEYEHDYANVSAPDFDISLNLDDGESDHRGDITHDELGTGIDNDDGEGTETGGSESSQTQKVMQKNGEMVSKSTVELATILRDKLMDTNSLTFTEFLEISQPLQAHNEKEKEEKEEEEEEEEEEVKLNKSEVSKTFFQMLSLASAGCVELKQEDPFGPISISGNAALYEKFIPA